MVSPLPRSSPPPGHAPRAAASLRQAVLATVLPRPPAGDDGPDGPEPLPGFGDLDVDTTDFWDRFRAAAPLHLRAAFSLGVWAIGSLLPRLMGSWRSLRSLPPARRDAVVRRADRLPVFRDLVDVVKLVAAMAYFRDPTLQARFRSPR